MSLLQFPCCSSSVKKQNNEQKPGKDLDGDVITDFQNLGVKTPSDKRQKNKISKLSSVAEKDCNQNCISTKLSDQRTPQSNSKSRSKLLSRDMKHDSEDKQDAKIKTVTTPGGRKISLRPRGVKSYRQLVDSSGSDDDDDSDAFDPEATSDSSEDDDDDADDFEPKTKNRRSPRSRQGKSNKSLVCES